MFSESNNYRLRESFYVEWVVHALKKKSIAGIRVDRLKAI